eukprot:820044-Amphidinium_carterae.1
MVVSRFSNFLTGRVLHPHNTGAEFRQTFICKEHHQTSTRSFFVPLVSSPQATRLCKLHILNRMSALLAQNLDISGNWSKLRKQFVEGRSIRSCLHMFCFNGDTQGSLPSESQSKTNTILNRLEINQRLACTVGLETITHPSHVPSDRQCRSTMQ